MRRDGACVTRMAGGERPVGGMAMRQVLGMTALAATVLAVCASGAGAASSIECNGALVGAFPGDIIAVGPCDLSGVTTVGGSVKVRPGASLQIDDGSPITINKNIESSKADFLHIQSGTVLGDVKLEGTVNETFISNLRVAHDLEVKKSTPYILVGPDAEIGGKARLAENKGNLAGDAIVQLSESIVDGDVTVQKNMLNGDFNVVVVANGQQTGHGSVGHNLAVQDNELTGGSFNGIQVTFNDTLRGDADVHGNKLNGPGDLQVSSNNLGHDLDVHDNRASAGAIDVSDNHAGHEIRCHGNKPPATSSAPNTAPNGKAGEGCIVVPPA